MAAQVALTPFCADARDERLCLRSFLLDLAGTLAVTSMGMGWSCVAGIKRWHLRRRPGSSGESLVPTLSVTMTATLLGVVSLLEGSLGSCCHLLIRVLRAKALDPLLVRTMMASRCRSPPWVHCFLEPRNSLLVARCLGSRGCWVVVMLGGGGGCGLLWRLVPWSSWCCWLTSHGGSWRR